MVPDAASSNGEREDRVGGHGWTLLCEHVFLLCCECDGGRDWVCCVVLGGCTTEEIEGEGIGGCDAVGVWGW